MRRFMDTLHKAIENTYRIDSGIHDISDFLMAEDVYRELEDDVVTHVPYDERARVYFALDGDDALLGMYIREDLREQLAKHDPLQEGITPRTLSPVSIITEETDHLVMLGYSLTHEKPTSLLELELQANITKCLVVRHMVAQQQGTYPSIDPAARQEVDSYILHTEFDEDDEDIQMRYVDAAQFAKGFMSYLDTLPRTEKPMELATFYRRTPQQKIDHIRDHAPFQC